MGTQGLNEDMLVQVERVTQRLQIPLSYEIELYMKQQEPSNIIEWTRRRTMARFHLYLFNNAVMICLFFIVLQCTPSAVAEYLQEVLTDFMNFNSMHYGSVSVWLVFVVAAGAYRPESLALAKRSLNISHKQGLRNIEDILRVAHQVWVDQGQLAAERQCDPGEVFVDWWDVMKGLDVDFLLL